MAKEIIEIERSFGSLLKKELPQFERVQPSLITILKAYSETNLSNLLGYLFRGDDHALLKQIFLRCLLDHLNFEDEFPRENEIEKYLSEIKIDIEYATKFGRIDILIRHDHPTQSKRWAIIIENKIYHTLNNDLDDYFFSVCSDFDILPRNTIVVILAFRKTSLSFHKHIKSQVVLHNKLKETILQEYIDHFSQINDRTATLIMNEYIRHIDDLYLQSTSSANQKCMEFFFENKALINELIAKLPDWEFDELNAINRKYLFDHKHKTEQIAALQKRVLADMDKVFAHYLDLSGRSVSGNSHISYFRGSGSSYDLIRYQLDYRSFFKGEASAVSFKVYLNRSFMDACSINPDNLKFIDKLGAAGGAFPKNTDRWVSIYDHAYQPENANIYDVIRDNLNEKWLDFEDYLSELFDKSQTEVFYSQLAQHIVAEDYQYREHESGLVFTNDGIDFNFQYKVAFIAPDYVEIILYGNIRQWIYYQQLLENGEVSDAFIIFDQRQAREIPELRVERPYDSVMNFEALAKKSFREKDTAKALQRFVTELSQFDKLTDYLAENIL